MFVPAHEFTSLRRLKAARFAAACPVARTVSPPTSPNPRYPPYHRRALDLDQHSRPREMRHRDQRARPENFRPERNPCATRQSGRRLRGSLMNTVMVTMLASRAAASAAGSCRSGRRSCSPGHRNCRHIVAGLIAGRGLAGEPHGAAAFGDHGRRIGARRLLLGFFRDIGPSPAPLAPRADTPPHRQSIRGLRRKEQANWLVAARRANHAARALWRFGRCYRRVHGGGRSDAQNLGPWCRGTDARACACASGWSARTITRVPARLVTVVS